MNSILEVSHLTKTFGKNQQFTAVDSISFSMKEGEILGFLGPNGAGKTTTIHMLTGITEISNGSISYFGKNFNTHKEYCLQNINFASAFNKLQGRNTVWENLLVFSYLYNIDNPKEKILKLVRYFESESLLPILYLNLSSGQKTRINIIKSLLNDPRVLLLDEPTASLDPDVADKTLTLIEELKKTRNISILYTSHDMSEITRICDRVIFINQGKIVAEDSPLNLTKKIKHAKLIVTFDGDIKKVKQYLTEKKLPFLFLHPYLVEISVEEHLIPKIIIGISNLSIWITNLEIKKPTLEDFFLQIARGDTYE